MIKKLRTKFIILSMTSLMGILLFIVVGMTVINYNSVVNEADKILSILSHNKGMFPDFAKDRERPLPPGMSPEIPYESRYFSVLLNESGNVIMTETSRIASVNPETAIEYARNVFYKNKDSGFVENYRYVCYGQGDAVRIIFLDCGRRLDSFKSFVFASVSMALAGFIIVFLIISFYAGKIIRPIAESYEKQKRFITDAGHEIKTPLAIISANIDVLKMELEDNECLDDISLQTERLTSLTNNLVYLARMEETMENNHKIEFPISDVVSDTTKSFKVLAQTQNKIFECEIEPMLSMIGNNKDITRLIILLMDNALKYSPKGGKISLFFGKRNKMLNLHVENTIENNISKESISCIFERFYRTDLSRNSEIGGHGIGLSIAKAIVSAHNGRIVASVRDESVFEIDVMFPI